MTKLPVVASTLSSLLVALPTEPPLAKVSVPANRIRPAVAAKVRERGRIIGRRKFCVQGQRLDPSDAVGQIEAAELVLAATVVEPVFVSPSACGLFTITGPQRIDVCSRVSAHSRQGVGLESHEGIKAGSAHGIGDQQVVWAGKIQFGVVHDGAQRRAGELQNSGADGPDGQNAVGRGQQCGPGARLINSSAAGDLSADVQSARWCC